MQTVSLNHTLELFKSRAHFDYEMSESSSTPERFPLPVFGGHRDKGGDHFDVSTQNVLELGARQLARSGTILLIAPLNGFPVTSTLS